MSFVSVAALNSVLLLHALKIKTSAAIGIERNIFFMIVSFYYFRKTIVD